MNREICRFTCSKCKKLRTESSYDNGICSYCRERSKREDSISKNTIDALNRLTEQK